METTGQMQNYNYEGITHVAPIKIYRVINNAICVLTTTDELKALRLLRKLGEKRDNTWEWIAEEQLV